MKKTVWIHGLAIPVLGMGIMAASGALSGAAEVMPLRLLVVTGGHDYSTSFYTLFDEPAKFHWDHAVSNHEAFRSDLREKYDVLVLYDMSAEISEAEKKNLVGFLESGKGMVVLHHAILDYPQWEWWWRDVVGSKYLSNPQGGMPASTYMHDQEIDVEPAAKHPILAGLGRMHLLDETYKGMWISPKVTPLLKTQNPASDSVIAWISPYEKSRVVYIQLGHGEPTHRNPDYRRLVHNAILWSAGKLNPKTK
jgi:type 1 glutamine amidotransferase